LRVFAQRVQHVAPMGGEIWHGGGPLLRAKFHPIGATIRVWDPPKMKFLLRFDQYVEYKRLAGAYPLRNFHKICRVYTPFQDALAVKILLDLLKGLWRYGGLKLVTPNFQRPPP